MDTKIDRELAGFHVFDHHAKGTHARSCSHADSPGVAQSIKYLCDLRDPRHGVGSAPWALLRRSFCMPCDCLRVESLCCAQETLTFEISRLADFLAVEPSFGGRQDRIGNAVFSGKK